jgi:hypothetical protein
MAGITKGAQAAYEWTMPGSTEGTANGTGLKTTTATYATESGTMTATLVVDGNTVQCSALQVNGAAITGCECTADAAEVDINGASATASWKVTGCTSDATITGYAWSTGVTGSDNTGSMTVSAKGEQTPTVTVSNAKGTKLDVTCATVKVKDSQNVSETLAWTQGEYEAGSYTFTDCSSATGPQMIQVNGGSADNCNTWFGASVTWANGPWGTCNGQLTVTFPVTLEVPEGGSITLGGCWGVQ